MAKQSSSSNVEIKRIVLRHQTGLKANQVEEFPLEHFKVVQIGRTATSDVKYDPDSDDLVSRQHARIEQDSADPTQFTITDLDSRNGTFVNKQRIIGLARIFPGDVIQLGPGGPEFMFDLEPRPDNLMRRTRVAENAAASSVSAAMAARSTRAAQDAPAIAPGPLNPMEPKTSVGRATVERMMSYATNRTNKTMMYAGTGLFAILTLIASLVYWQNQRDLEGAQEEIEKAKEDLTGVVEDIQGDLANLPMTPRQISDAYTEATVFFEVSWKLINTLSGREVYHSYVKLLDANGQEVKDQRGQTIVRAAYIRLPDGSIEPLLNDDGQGQPIGGPHTGSGFVVTSDGFILTNRHVAATWNTRYTFDRNSFPGILYERGQDGRYQQSRLIEQNEMGAWVPAESKFFGQKPLEGKILEGRNDYLNVTFPRNELRVPASLARVSNRHDVAMVKVDVPQPLTKVELFDNYDAIKSGDGITVMGYPAISPDVVVAAQSQDPFNPQTQVVSVPDPTITSGIVSRVIKGSQAPEGRTSYEYASFFGDSYQLDINATGGGNSGGPMFDEKGRVIGIFYAARNWSSYGDAHITFAVPIKYGIELMGTQSVLQ